MNMGRVLVAEDNSEFRELVAMALRDKGYIVREASDGEEAIGVLRSEPHDLVLSDLKMPRLDGMGLLRRTRELHSPPAFIMVTAHGSIRESVQALQEGAVDFLEKPVDLDELDIKVAQAIGSHAPLGTGASQIDGVVGNSPQMLEVADLIQRVADVGLPVLFCGERGTGRRHLARALHGLADRAPEPFVTVSCSAPAPMGAEAEIFGAEAGALGPGSPAVKGRMEEAAKGTLVLEDVDALPAPAQHRLYRLLSSRSVERLGGMRAVHCDARVLATVRPGLDEAMRQGRFREDLYYRLSSVTVTIPPLRDRKEDIPGLIKHFAAKASGEQGRRVEFSPRAGSLLREYSWPGNVTELETVVEGCVARANGGFVEEAELPANLRAAIAGGADSLTSELEGHERARLVAVLERYGWNQTHASKALGIGRTSLQYKMQKYNLKRPA